MSAEVNPVAIHYLPIFITPPGETDVLTVVTAIFLLVSVVAFGLLFLRLHSLPERMAHRGHKLQFEVVAVLCLISLFTHNHAFWIAALLLAFVELPDIPGWMGRIAGGVDRIAEIRSEITSIIPSGDEVQIGHKPGGAAVAVLGNAQTRPVKGTEVSHD